MKAIAETNGQTIEIDTEGMEKRLGDKMTGDMKKYFEELKTINEQKRDANGKGVVEAFSPDARKAVVEEFQKGEGCNPQRIKEQWTICVPKYAVSELAGHLRDFVWVTDAVKGKPGEVVNIPYVNDIDFSHFTPHTGTPTGKVDLVGVVQTTLHESGAYYDAYYGDIEKIDSNMLDELNRVFAHAAVRAEDADLITLLNTGTTGQFVSEGGGSNSLDPVWVGTISSNFNDEMIIDGLGALMQRGKEVHPGECIVYMNGECYKDLLKSVAASTPLATANAGLWTKGMLEDLYGVKIVVGSKKTAWHCAGGRYVSSYNWAWFFRPKRCLALAPKRDILIETDKLIKERQLRIVGSHTYGVAVIDYTEAVPILSNSSPSAG